MKSTAIVCAITVASLGFGSLSFAQGFDRRGPGGEWQRVEQQRVEQRGPMHRDYNRDNDGRDFGSRNFDPRDTRNDRQFGARGPQFYRGGHIPMEYRNRQHAVNNWRAQRLSAPSRDQQWVQVGADYALIAIATGVIAQLVLNQ